MRWNLAVAALATSWGFISVIVVGVTLGPVPLSVFRTALAGGGGGGHVRPLAIAIGLLGALTYTVLVVLTKDLTARLNPLTIAFWDYAVATVALTPFLPTADRILPHWGEVPWIVLLGV